MLMSRNLQHHRNFFLVAGTLIISCFAFTTAAQTADTDVLAAGDPPLTSGMAGKVIGLLQWSLDIQFTEAQGTEIIREMMSYWKSGNRSQIQNITEIAKVADGILNSSPGERARAKTVISSELVKSLERDQSDRLSQMVLTAYRSTHKNRQLTDQSLGGRVASDGFTGIYVGTRNFASSINSVQMDYVTFLPGGNVYWTLPAEGLLSFDPNTAKRAHPDEWGAYQISGNTIRVTLGPRKLIYVFTKEAGSLKLQPHSGGSAVRTYSRLSTADGLTLSGSYRRFEGDPAITFSPDGTFRDEGIFRNFGTMARPDGSVYQADGRGGTGTYAVGQNTLELKYRDGRVKRVAFTALPEAVAANPVKSFRINYEVFTLSY